VLGVNLEDAVEMARDIDHDARSDHLPGEGSSRRSRNERSMILACKGDQLANILFGLGKRDGLWHLPINRRIGGIELPHHRVEMQRAFEFRGKSLKVGSTL
jgi:hypothetical protein